MYPTQVGHHHAMFFLHLLTRASATWSTEDLSRFVSSVVKPGYLCGRRVCVCICVKQHLVESTDTRAKKARRHTGYAQRGEAHDGHLEVFDADEALALEHVQLHAVVGVVQLDVTGEHGAEGLEHQHAQDGQRVRRLRVARQPGVRVAWGGRRWKSGGARADHIRSTDIHTPRQERTYPSLKTKAATALLAPARMSASSSMMVPLMNVTRLSISGASSTSTSCDVC